MIDIKQSFKRIIFEINQLFIPHICLGCATHLPYHLKHICINCTENLTLTGFHSITDNLVYNLLSLQAKINNACSIYYFQTNTPIQFVIHNFKYNNHPELASYLGQLSGKQLKQSALYSNIDYIIPIPLHDKKYIKRGYNQSEKLGKGLSQELKIPLLTKVLIRHKNTLTQAQIKTKAERNKNLLNAFMLKNTDQLNNKHILLIDDVFTTGATILNAINTLNSVPNIKISVVTLALKLD